MKENAKKTKWYIHWPEEDFCRIVITDSSNGAYQKKHVIAQVAKRHRLAKQNAHLIAAAPEMYDMLDMLASCGCISNGIYTAAIRKLLAKARGEGSK